MKLQRGFDTQCLLSMLEKALAREKQLWSPKIFEDKCEENEIKPESRNSLVKWLAHLTKKFDFLPETYELAVCTFDRLLQSVKVRVKHMKVIGIACLYLAAKTLQEDNTIPATLELVRESQCGCSVAEIHRMELVILDKVGWDLRAPSALEFMQLFLALLLDNSPQLLHGMAHMTSECLLTLLTEKLQIAFAYHGFMSFRPSTLALALLSVELELFHSDWFSYTVCLERLVKCDMDSLMICRERQSLYLASVQHTPRVLVQQAPVRHLLPTSTKAAKRKVDEIEGDDDDDDVDDVYNDIKRLYGDDDVSGITATKSVTTETYASVVKRSLLSSSPPSSSSTSCASQLQLELRAKNRSAPTVVMTSPQAVAVK